MPVEHVHPVQQLLAGFVILLDAVVVQQHDAGLRMVLARLEAREDQLLEQVRFAGLQQVGAHGEALEQLLVLGARGVTHGDVQLRRGGGRRRRGDATAATLPGRARLRAPVTDARPRAEAGADGHGRVELAVAQRVVHHLL